MTDGFETFISLLSLLFEVFMDFLPWLIAAGFFLGMIIFGLRMKGYR